MSIFLARQGIYDRKSNVVAYELLYRNSEKNTFPIHIDEGYSTIKLMSNIAMIGIYEITNGRKAFINYPKNIIKTGLTTFFPKENIVIEVLESVELTEEIIVSLKSLKEMGYEIALDDVVDADRIDGFIDVIDIIKIDFKSTSKKIRKTIVNKIKDYNIRLLAEKVETQEEYQEAYEDNYDYFQGYYFNKPILLKDKDMSINKRIYSMIMLELMKEDFDINTVEDIIKSDTTLTYKLLKFLNCGYFGFLAPIKSVKQAITLLGRNKLRRWILLIAVSKVSNDEESINNTIIRGRFCEIIQEEINPEKSQKAFLVGLFSNLDMSMGKDMNTVLKGINLDSEIRDALMGKENTLGDILNLIKCYETLNFNEIAESCKKLNIKKETLAIKYVEALKWSTNLLNNIV